MKAETNRKDVYRKALCLLIPAAGLAFLLWYIKNATCDVVYSDYIRLVNSYLPDVYDPDRFFVPDVLTRIPINYLGRIINVELFGFSITFDRVLGAVSTALAAWVFGLYFIRHKLGSIWFFYNGRDIQPESMGDAYKWKRLVPLFCLCLFLLP